MSKTTDNLKAAFAGESQARNKYTFFAKVARKEGYHYIAKIFEETAENEKQHAKDHLKLLNGIGDTVANLKEAYGAGRLRGRRACTPDLPKMPRKKAKRKRPWPSSRLPKSRHITEQDTKNCSRWSSLALSLSASKRSSGNAAFAAIRSKVSNHRRNVHLANTPANTTNRPVWIFKWPQAYCWRIIPGHLLCGPQATVPRPD